jgi:hypothetical protein
VPGVWAAGNVVSEDAQLINAVAASLATITLNHYLLAQDVEQAVTDDHVMEQPQVQVWPVRCWLRRWPHWLSPQPASAQAPTPPPKSPGVGVSTMVACGISYPDKDFSGWVTFPVTTVTLRSGPSNSCIQTGQGIPGQRADYFCYAPGDGGTWTFLRNVSTGDQGWVRDDLLAGNGSQVSCE